MQNNDYSIDDLNSGEGGCAARLLAYSVGEEKSRECVDKLFMRYGSFVTVCSASEDEICRICGVGKSTALLIKLVAYLNSRRVTERFEFGIEHTELELREYIGALFLGLSVENVYALLLNEKGRVVAAEHISEGTFTASDVVPRKLLECANRRGCARIILAHNHPKGSSAPSKDDLATTGRLFNLLASVGIRLCAHYIVADGEIDKIETDMFYDPKYFG